MFFPLLYWMPKIRSSKRTKHDRCLSKGVHHHHQPPGFPLGGGGGPAAPSQAREVREAVGRVRGLPGNRSSRWTNAVGGIDGPGSADAVPFSVRTIQPNRSKAR